MLPVRRRLFAPTPPIYGHSATQSTSLPARSSPISISFFVQRAAQPTADAPQAQAESHAHDPEAQQPAPHAPQPREPAVAPEPPTTRPDADAGPPPLLPSPTVPCLECAAKRPRKRAQPDLTSYHDMATAADEFLRLVRRRLQGQADELDRKTGGLEGVMNNFATVQALWGFGAVSLQEVEDMVARLTRLRARLQCAARATAAPCCDLCTLDDHVELVSLDAPAMPCCGKRLCSRCAGSLRWARATARLESPHAISVVLECTALCPFCRAHLPPRRVAVDALNVDALYGYQSESDESEGEP